MIPVARASPITFTMVLKRSLDDDPEEEHPPPTHTGALTRSWPRNRSSVRTGGSAFTYNAQSTAMISVMSSVGSPTEVSTITMVTSPACGIPAAPMLAAVAVMLKRRRFFIGRVSPAAGTAAGASRRPPRRSGGLRDARRGDFSRFSGPCSPESHF